MRQLCTLLIIFSFLFVVNAKAQISVSNPSSIPDVSAMLDVKSTTKGMLVPRMNSSQRTGIGSPARGLLVFDTETNTFWFHNGSGWTELAQGAAGASFWSSDGFQGNIYNTNTGRVSFGTSAVGPAYINIKAPVSNMMTLFMSETGTTAADFLFSGIYTGGGTTSTRYGTLMGNFGNGFGIGNQSNAPLIFQTYTSEKMRITASGNVGINTLNPTSQLQVNTTTGTPGITHTDGTVRFSTLINSSNAAIGTTTNHNLFFFTNNNINTNPPAMTISTAGNVGIGGSIASDKLEVYTPNASYGITHTAGSVRLGTYIGANAGWIGTKTDNPLHLFTANGNPSMTLLQNGNAGIGTSSPTARLHVLTNSASNGYPQLLVEENDNDYARINLKTTNALNSGNNFWTIAGYNNNTRSSERLNFYNYAAGDIMSLTGNGNVGIGTTNPTYKLSVNGTIQTKEVIVETGWADFVFEDDYKLPALKDVEDFIKANKHLPGIAPAKEIQQKGLGVAEAQTKMMQKIEELTLYLIEANKQITDLKEKVSKLETKNDNK